MCDEDTRMGYIAQVSETAVYSVPSMHCSHCERAVQEEVSTVSGVTAVDVDLERKLVTVAGAPLDDAAVRAAIEAAGYEVV
jgi:copper chaperone